MKITPLGNRIMTFAERTIKFYESLQIEALLPEGVEVLNPYKDQSVIDTCKLFYSKYYNDSSGRRIIFGINPGRFGAGITGIPFTDPLRLENNCGIPNDYNKRPELSSEFIYMLIKQLGGPEHFYKHYFIGAVSPLGFVKNGKNYNYYDSPELQRLLKPFIIRNLIEQIGLGINSRKCYCLGQGKNYAYLQEINKQLALFDQIIPIPHPRWVMQYKRKDLRRILLMTSKLLSV
ncbi:MAG: DUF4918 family protein [Bacteroidetes bacterium]|nr:DUF4918 family protein [Bacteroidota bacterium]